MYFPLKPILLISAISVNGKLFTLEKLVGQEGKFDLRKSDLSFEASFDSKGVVTSLTVNLIGNKGYRIDISIDKSGNLARILPRKYQVAKSQIGVPLGINLSFHESGNILRRFISSGIDGEFGVSEPCDWEYRYDESGKLTEKTFHKQKCLYGKGLIAFFLPPGTYYVTEPPLRLRAEPNLKSKTIANLEKDEKVEVLDFTKERLEINGFYAPWAKVKTAKGEGWVYGGFIEPVNYGETYKKYFQNIDWQKFVEKMGLE